MHSKVKDVLVNARAKIARGWIQGRGSAGESVCSAFALNAAAAEVLTYEEMNSTTCGMANEAGDVLMQAVSEVTGDDWDHNLVGWNDYRGRTKDEVLDTFDYAIKLAERDG